MFARCTILILLAALSVGCGSTKSRTATEQLLASDAVDAAIAKIDLSPLAGQKVYFDREYIKDYAPNGFVNADYVVSALRHQIVTSGCLLQEKREEADFVIEGRIGALGTNSHDIIYGLPANNILNAAASVVPTPTGAATLPTIPEISLMKKNDQVGAAKLGLFAYHRESKERVWQSGISVARSTAKDMWFFGAGPFQSGTVYDGVRFAGSRLKNSEEGEEGVDPSKLTHLRQATVYTPPSEFMDEPAFANVASEEESGDGDKVVPASAEVPADK